MPGITDEQIQQAKRVDLLSYLQSHEPHSIIRQGADRYILRDHDSFVISNGKFCWNSRGYGRETATALAYLIDVRGMAFADAVHQLTDGRTYPIERPTPKAESIKPKKPFTLPPANANNDKVYAYLRGRGIDSEIIKWSIENGSLYESAKSHNCVFVGFDGDKPRLACERGTTDDYKKDVSGSNKRFSFSLPPNTSDNRNLALMEAPVDVLSHATLHKMSNSKWDGYRLSLGGVSSVALMSFLERHPQIENVLLCLDNDKAGKDATSRIIRELLSDKRFSHLKITVAPPPLGKDYADTLQAIHQLNKERTRNDRPKEAAFLF